MSFFNSEMYRESLAASFLLCLDEVEQSQCALTIFNTSIWIEEMLDGQVEELEVLSSLFTWQDVDVVEEESFPLTDMLNGLSS